VASSRPTAIGRKDTTCAAQVRDGMLGMSARVPVKACRLKQPEMSEVKAVRQGEGIVKVDLYSINLDDSERVEALDVTLESCFPDHPDDAARMRRDLEQAADGVAYYGDEASPLFKFVRRP